MLDIGIMFLDRDNLFKIGLTACALGVSIFVLWGPKLGRKGNVGGLIGLQNLGLTCFLNSLLQALASCPIFIEWLEDLKGNGPVTNSLLSILTLLCFERSEDDDDDDEGWSEKGDVASPRELISSLSRHGWSIAPQEQDTHELFLLLVTTLEEEDAKANLRNKGSLIDALCENTLESHQVTSHGDLKVVRIKSSTNVFMGKTLSSPFRGYLTSQLQCLSCCHRSSVRYDKFDSLSLHLPMGEGDVKLKDLLDGLVRSEVLDFACEVCAKSNPSLKTKATKTVRIGKLPKCLCLHISRTNMSSSGILYKRENYVDFPEFLSMTNFTQNSTSKDVLKCGEQNHNSALLDKVQEVFMATDQEGNNNTTANKPSATKLPSVNGLVGGGTRHMYRVKAVVEHKGSVENGHFVTYRRGPLRSTQRHRSCPSRWFFTSDAEVKKSSMCDALLANAYMIFYERCSS